MSAAVILFVCISVPMVVAYLAVNRWLEDRQHVRDAKAIRERRHV